MNRFMCDLHKQDFSSFDSFYQTHNLVYTLCSEVSIIKYELFTNTKALLITITIKCPHFETDV